jgi:hypothetical protein
MKNGRSITYRQFSIEFWSRCLWDWFMIDAYIYRKRLYVIHLGPLTLRWRRHQSQFWR